MHMICIRPSFYKHLITLFAKENFGGVFSSLVTYFSQYILNKRTISHSSTILLFKVAFGNKFIVFL